MERNQLNIADDEDPSYGPPVEREPEPAPKPRKAAPRRQNLDPRRLTIESEIAVPTTPPRKQSKWIPVLQRMSVGDSLLVKDATLARMRYVRNVAARLGMNIVARRTDDGVRLWKVASGAMGDGL